MPQGMVGGWPMYYALKGKIAAKKWSSDGETERRSSDGEMILLLNKVIFRIIYIDKQDAFYNLSVGGWKWSSFPNTDQQ